MQQKEVGKFAEKLAVIENLSSKNKEKTKSPKHMQAEYKKEDHANTSENSTDETLLYVQMPTVNMKQLPKAKLFSMTKSSICLTEENRLHFDKYGWNFGLFCHFLKLC